MSLSTIVELASSAVTALLAEPAPVSSYDLTAGRIWSLVGAAAGLVGVVAGVPALRRTWKKGAVVALAAGAAGMVVGGIVVAAAKGGPGTGYGIVGGYVDLVIGLAAVGLGALTLSRLRRRSKTS